MTSLISAPQPLGLRKSFGFGDRLGLATPGHLDAARQYDFAPIFAQQSIREMERTGRTPHDVMRDAQNALAAENFSGLQGADADHLKTPDDARQTAAAGFTFFTIDPSEYVNDNADEMSQMELETRCAQLVAEGVLPRDWQSEYSRGGYEIEGETLTFSPETLQRAAVKYARAALHCETMARAIEDSAREYSRGFEIEVSVDETATPTSAREHLFFALELQRRGVPFVSLAPRFVGDMEKGIDYRGDLGAFESSLRRHVNIARAFGPYKISVHSGSDKFAIYPIVGRVCDELLHVKTAGTSYLEALRVLARTDFTLFENIVGYAHGRFDEDRRSYHISTTQSEVAALMQNELSSPKEAERLYLDERVGRQLLHVTFGSVLTRGVLPNGRTFRDALYENLQANAALHRELLRAHFEKHLSLLNAG